MWELDNAKLYMTLNVRTRILNFILLRVESVDGNSGCKPIEAELAPQGKGSFFFSFFS